jgi:quercetin 2,3-dioxygenase
MTTATATVLPRRQPPGPPGQAEARAVSTLPVLGGSAADGQPTGALFLLAHSRYCGEFEFRLHRHEGLEILTIILDGTMSHYDTAADRWADLKAGDAQMMRSGSGISHIERAADGTRGFQIQFDPGYQAALRREPSYTDYPAASFTAQPTGDALVTEIVGHDGPVQAHTEGLSVSRVAVPADGRAQLDVGPGRLTLAYLIDGTATINGAAASSDDTISLNGAQSLTADAATSIGLLIVSVPASPSYQPRRLDSREMAEHGAPGGLR